MCNHTRSSGGRRRRRRGANRNRNRNRGEGRGVFDNMNDIRSGKNCPALNDLKLSWRSNYDGDPIRRGVLVHKSGRSGRGIHKIERAKFCGRKINDGWLLQKIRSLFYLRLMDRGQKREAGMYEEPQIQTQSHPLDVASSS